MSGKVTRRSFMTTTATAAAAAGVGAAAASAVAPEMIVPKGVPPIVIASANGHLVTNGGPRTCVAEVWERLGRGQDVLEAIVEGAAIVELDPEDSSVGFGGLPNADGVVQLDACVMHGGKRQAGGVAALEGVRTPARVARAVLDMTDHHLIVGRGAQEFARQMGFTVESDLNTERSRALWLEWKRRIDPEHWPDREKRERAAASARDAMIAEGLLDPARVFGTLHCAALDARGTLAGATTTSGLAFKIPGRVGDSPILGAGNYVAGGIGTAGSTGRGEANLFQLSSFLIVELMRQGRHPKDACFEALRRVQTDTVERRLLNPRGLPAFDLKFYALNARGDHAGVSLYGGKVPTYAVCDAGGPRTLRMDALHEGIPAG